MPSASKVASNNGVNPYVFDNSTPKVRSKFQNIIIVGPVICDKTSHTQTTHFEMVKTNFNGILEQIRSSQVRDRHDKTLKLPKACLLDERSWLMMWFSTFYDVIKNHHLRDPDNINNRHHFARGILVTNFKFIPFPEVEIVEIRGGSSFHN